MISFPDTALETPPPPDEHEWWALSQLGDPPSHLFVVCKITMKAGVVWNPSQEELDAAAGEADFKFKITDPSRVEITQEGGGNE